MRKGENGFSILFLSPALVIYLIFVIVPIFLAAYYTFLDWSGAGVPNFFGFGNYARMIDDFDYWKTVKNSFTLVLLAILIQNPVGIGLAYLTSKAKAFRRFFRSSIFMPVVISATATGLMFSLLLNTDIGIFNRLLDAIGLGILKRSWLSDPKVVLYSVAVPQVWQYLGITYMLYLAAIQSIPNEIYESARIDGASSFLTLVKIVLPLIRDVLIISIILNVTGSLKAFDISWIMTWGGPGVASSYISTYMYKMAIKGFDFSYGITVAMSIFIYSIIFSVVFKKIFSRESDIY